MESRIFCIPPPPLKIKLSKISLQTSMTNKINTQTPPPPKKNPISYVKAWVVHFVTLKHKINYCICVFQKIEDMTINKARAKKICLQHNSNYLKRTWIYNAVIEQIYSVSIANFRANTPHTDWHSNLLISQVTFIIYLQ